MTATMAPSRATPTTKATTVRTQPWPPEPDEVGGPRRRGPGDGADAGRQQDADAEEDEDPEVAQLGEHRVAGRRPRTPKIARIPSRSALSQPVPASTRPTTATTPEIDRAAPVGALTSMMPSGWSGGLDEAGQQVVDGVLGVRSSSWGWLRSTMPKTVKASSTAGKTEKKAK